VAIKLIDPYNDPHFPTAGPTTSTPEADAASGLELKGTPASVLAGAAPKPKKIKAKAKSTTSKTKVVEDPYGREQILMDDFRQFMAIVWDFLGLPEPSEVQLALAWWLQHGPSRAIILGFRGMAKSWITGAYILWTLYRDPQKKIMVVSASLERAVGTVQWCLALIREMPELQFLAPDIKRGQRASGKSFDVGPATPDQSPSLRGAGINGQLAGSRAHLIVPDDVEIPSNSMTTVMREKISEAVKEFDAILHPNAEIKYLGTPQVDDSLYVKLQKRGYVCRIWPARFPDKKMRIKYGDRLSPWVTERVEADPTLVGHSVWPSRFSDSDLDNRELSYGRSGFALQFMLDTSLADADRYPLKLRDLIVMPLDMTQGPSSLVWSNASEHVVNDLPIMGFEGDRFYGPAVLPDKFEPYSSIKASLDTSGRGSNQTALNILAELNGRLFHLYCGGWLEGYSPETLKAISEACVRYRVQELYPEDNYGDGMFTALLTPVLNKAWEDFNRGKPEHLRGGTDIIPVKSSKAQKELRMLSALEPASQQHRLVVSSQVIEADQRDIRAMVDAMGADNVHHYSLWHQWTHLSREKDSLIQDDKLEGLSIAVALYADLLGINPEVHASRKQAEADEALEEELLAEADGAAGRDGPPVSRAHKSIRPSRSSGGDTWTTLPEDNRRH
jgi:hypothetical protein